MVYICGDCKRVFTSEQAATRSERIGDFWGAPAYTEYLVCPDCHSDEIEEYIPNEEEGEEDGK